MPQFVLKFVPNKPHWWPKGRAYQNADRDLRDFACGYVEALFFTNGDSGDDDEFSFNRLGAERLTQAARASIIDDCASFLSDLARDAIARSDGDYEQAGRDFWFTRQGHGVGFWDKGEDIWPKEARDALNARAKGFGEAYMYRKNGWIYVA